MSSEFIVIGKKYNETKSFLFISGTLNKLTFLSFKKELILLYIINLVSFMCFKF